MKGTGKWSQERISNNDDERPRSRRGHPREGRARVHIDGVARLYVLHHLFGCQVLRTLGP